MLFPRRIYEVKNMRKKHIFLGVMAGFMFSMIWTIPLAIMIIAWIAYEILSYKPKIDDNGNIQNSVVGLYTSTVEEKIHPDISKELNNRKFIETQDKLK